jgi:hypothetical protein
VSVIIESRWVMNMVMNLPVLKWMLVHVRVEQINHFHIIRLLQG